MAMYVASFELSSSSTNIKVGKTLQNLTGLAFFTGLQFLIVYGREVIFTDVTNLRNKLYAIFNHGGI